MSDLAFEVMGGGQPHYHFGTQRQLQIGEAFAAAYRRDVGKLPTAKSVRVRLFALAGLSQFVLLRPSLQLGNQDADKDSPL